MPNPWLAIPLEDYEGHMNSAEVQQLAGLAELFRRVLDFCRPESVAVLGVAGGNGLEQIDSAAVKRIVGVDINPGYLEEVRRRYGRLSGLELHCGDLRGPLLEVGPVALVHAALIFEHVGLGAALENALSLVEPGGRLSVVLQLPSAEGPGVSCTNYTSMQTLRQGFEFIEISELQSALEQRGFRQVEQARIALPGGKALWMGIFEIGI